MSGREGEPHPTAKRGSLQLISPFLHHHFYVSTPYPCTPTPPIPEGTQTTLTKGSLLLEVCAGPADLMKRGSTIRSSEIVPVSSDNLIRADCECMHQACFGCCPHLFVVPSIICITLFNNRRFFLLFSEADLISSFFFPSAVDQH